MAGAEDRARAARLLLDVLHKGRTTDQSFGNQTVTPLVAELVYGTLRYYYSLTEHLEVHLAKALRSKDLDLRCLMLVGAYQLFHTRIPVHAVLHETVNACRGLRKPWAANLVNAVLRKLADVARTSSEGAVSAGIESNNERSFELPHWLFAKLSLQYESLAPALMRACLDRAPMSLRVNVQRISITDYRHRLLAADLPCHQGWLAENLILDAPVPARRLPGLTEGLVSIQDPGAMFACGLLTGSRLKPTPADTAESPRHLRILDACAAPGGKLFHLAESHPDALLTGVELNDKRMAYLRAEAERLGHTRITLLAGDASNRSWWSGEPFDAILLDAPCSGTGTLRRHPDIKILRQMEDLPDYARLQRALLENLWQMLNPGGLLLYCTCSLLEEENDSVIGSFLNDTPSAANAPFELPTGIPTRHGWQLLPIPESADPQPARSVDGFYYARLIRHAKAE